MSRTKIKESITSKQEATAAMCRLNIIDETIATWNLREAAEIARIREYHHQIQGKEGRPAFEAEKKLLLRELESWAKQDLENWGKARSMATAFGAFGFRKGNPTVTLIKKKARNWNQALEWLQILGMVVYGYVRNAPEIAKDKILADHAAGELNEENLAKCGLQVTQKEEFWVETTAGKDLEDAAEKLREA